MKKKVNSVLACLFAVVAIVACSPQTFDDKATQTVPVPSMAQATEVPTPTLTSTPTSIPTNTSTATPTPSPTPTATPTPTETPTPTPLPTAAQQTPVPPASPPQPHVFPETPILPFDEDVFIRYLGLVRDSYRSAADEFPKIFSGAKKGDCGTYIGWFALWVAEAPGFQDVPPEWYPLYAEYRAMLQEAVSVTWEIHEVCEARGGTVSEETDAAAQAFIDWAYPRSEEMVIEAKQLREP